MYSGISTNKYLTKNAYLFLKIFKHFINLDTFRHLNSIMKIKSISNSFFNK